VAPNAARARSGLAVLVTLAAVALVALFVWLVAIDNGLAWLVLGLLAILSFASKATFSLWRHPADHQHGRGDQGDDPPPQIDS